LADVRVAQEVQLVGYTQAKLWAPSQIPAADTLYYTSPPLTKTRVVGLVVVNTTTGPVTIRITHGAMAVAQALCWDFSVPADGLPYDILEGQGQVIMEAADVIRAQAATAASITFHGYGVQIT